GLSSAIFTSDLERGEQIASNLEFGMVHVNDQTVATDEYAPFGGIKNSGIGRFGTPFIIDEFTELKWVTVQQTKRSYPF
ncbi:aldehyde dehydrogenase family protein, partial [Staphylococcus epidermidis]